MMPQIPSGRHAKRSTATWAPCEKPTRTSGLVVV